MEPSTMGALTLMSLHLLDLINVVRIIRKHQVVVVCNCINSHERKMLPTSSIHPHNHLRINQMKSNTFLLKKGK